MFSADVFVIEPLGLLVGQLHHFPGAIGETLVHGRCFLRESEPTGECLNGSRHPAEKSTCKTYAKPTAEF